MEVAEETGKIADAFGWPTHGRKPERFPFFVSARIGGYGTPVDAAVTEREEKTLSYFGFTPEKNRVIHGLWHMEEGSYCRPDLGKMTERAASQAAEFRAQGGSVEDIVYCMLMDEPTGQATSFIAQDAAYGEAFREWLREMGLEPADLLMADWGEVRPVTDAQRDEFPALYYFTQRFRTRALGDFMATQRRILEEAYGGTFPVLVNFSDGAVYMANFCLQGVDYFELLDSDDQNAIWGEDWSNLASTYQCGAYNVDLMRAAARERGQTLGHYLIAYAGRKPWDIKLKATSEVARGVKALTSFSYGPSWGSHEGGPHWVSTQWYAKPETWSANAGIVREIGGAEDMLTTAMPAPAKVAILYSSSTDVWTLSSNYAYGFDRMHSWLALAHAQIPADIVSERQVAKGMLDEYQVCYLSGPNLSRAAAARVKEWVEAGGTLWLSAGAAARDEYNRPLSLLNDILPADRQGAEELQKHLSAGKSLYTLAGQDEARWDAGTAEVLSVKQNLAPRGNAEVLAAFSDGSPAAVRGAAGLGSVYCVGFLPALAYIKAAEVARNELHEGTDDPAEAELLERSYNPWDYPADVREFILAPVRSAGVEAPIACSVPLVDAVYMTCDEGILIPLANYTLRPIEQLSLKVAVARPVARVESVRHGALEFSQAEPGRLDVRLPVDNNDFVKLYFR